MKEYYKDKNILFLTVPLSILMAIVSYAGIFIESTYSRETVNYAAQGIGQDIVNLFLVLPVLLISSFYAYQKNKIGLFLWSGAIFYIAYSYTLYCFAVHFNSFFIAYCFILGLSFYSLIYFLFKSMKENVTEWFNESIPRKSTSIYLLTIAIVFYFLWLSEIVPAIINQKIPASIVENGLLTNPVHVLDLAICLPALIITAVLLLRKNAVGYLLVPALLSFCILMAVAIASMVIVLKMKGLEADIILTVIFGVITLTSTTFLFKYLKGLK